MTLVWQQSLLAAAEPACDETFAGAERRDLGSGAWLETVPRWVDGADTLLATVLDDAPWAEHSRPMYDQVVVEIWELRFDAATPAMRRRAIG